jgi:hypothetical protein
MWSIWSRHQRALQGQKLKVGLPSLRIESVSIDLMDKLKEQRSGGFTLAPEAATERMRRIINKYIPDEEIIDTTREIYRRGWTTIKLYFMIGHPSETLEDVQAIADLCKRVIAEGTQGGRHEGQTARGRQHLRAETTDALPVGLVRYARKDPRQTGPAAPRTGRDRNIKLSLDNPDDTLLEAWLSRGDRKMAEVVYTAWKNGSKFDAWGEGKNSTPGWQAFDEHGLDPPSTPTASAARTRSSPGSISPPRCARTSCSRISACRSKGQIRVDCRLNCFACGILPTFADLRRENPGEVWQCPDVKSPATPSDPESSPV